MADELELAGGGGGGETVISRLLEDEMRESFIDYSMSVIVQRALPDVRDGLKPVHRRILYAMSELGLGPGRAYKKSATVVGDVLGKYHPHGDSAVYDSMVRMVQPFSLRYPLVDGQGNFGSVDGDSAAAYRYTEARLQRLALELVEDIDKDTVAFADNFDGSMREPTVLPSKFPNLLVNGSSGIAVGMATNIPPHNLREINAAVEALIDDPDLPQERLEHIVTGPDFPTGGFVCGREGIRDAYRTGRGRIVMRARADIEEIDANSERIVVTEIPFMVNKSRLIEQIAHLVRDKKLTEIRDLRDESDRQGMRIVIELKRDAVPHIVLNKLYKHTQMQSTFGTILLALVDGQPKIMPLREMLQHFIAHRLRVIVRRSEFDLAKALEREHILEGLKIAVDNIDEIIKIIRAADDSEQASTQLQETFELSERQAKAILDMRLARLTGLEIEKLEEELGQVQAQIEELRDILSSEDRRSDILKGELHEITEKYGDERRTEITGAVGDFNVEDLIVEEDMVITVSHKGYVKRLPVDTYRAQRRGGRGLRGMDTKEEDWVEHLFVASTHDYIMIFTRGGQCYWLKVWEIPVGGRTSRGKPIVNLLNLSDKEGIASVVPVREFSEDRNLMFCTRQGVVKKTELSAYGNVRSVGLNAINIREGDELIDVRITEGDDEIILASRDGKAIRFQEGDARKMGRATEGVRGIDLAEGDVVVGMVVVRDDSTLLVVSEKGLGKRTAVDAYRMQRRGGKGVINLKVSQKTGKVVSIKSVRDDEQLMLITRNGVVNRQPVAAISVIGRATQGVKLMNLDKGDSVVDVAWVIMGDDEEDDEALDAAVDAAEQEGADERSLEGEDIETRTSRTRASRMGTTKRTTHEAARVTGVVQGEGLVGLPEIEAAARRLQGVAIRTPLLPSEAVSDAVGATVRLKCESLQRAGSFKIRGAYNFVSQLSDEQVADGIITYSSGNHAQAVAMAGKLRGLRAVVVMPTTAPKVKVEGAKRLGAEVVFEGTTSLERKARAEAIAEEEGLVVVPPFDHRHIIAGQGTVGFEIAREWKDVDLVLAPIGGGGLASGIAAAVKRMLPSARVIGVEPEGAASMRAALDAGKPVRLDRIDTIADGLAPVIAGHLTFEHARKLMDDVVTVSDDAIREATALLVGRQKLIVEFSGAATTAALLSGKVDAHGRSVAVVLSGGNLDPSLLAEVA